MFILLILLISPCQCHTNTNTLVNAVRDQFYRLAHKQPNRFDAKDLEHIRANSWWVERFVRAYGDVNKALDNMIKTMEWRNTFGVNNLTEHQFPDQLKNNDFIEIVPRDKRGLPVYWGRLALFKNELGDLMKQYIVYMMEKVDRNVGRKGWAAVIDANDAGLHNVDIDLFRFVVYSLLFHYPSAVKQTIAVDLPWWLKGLTQTLMLMADEESRSKAKFITRQELTLYFDQDQLPAYLNRTEKDDIFSLGDSFLSGFF